MPATAIQICPASQRVTTATYVYDGDGNRVKGVVGEATMVYLGSHFEWRVETSGSTAVQYYYAGSQRVAMRAGGTLYYLFGDHLGSTSLTTDASGNLAAELRYLPFGETRYSSGITPTSFRYTGQRESVESGLYFYGARWYDSSLGRFIQADTIIPSPTNPMAWDRYAYVLNNPVRLTDPSGHFYCEGDDCEHNIYHTYDNILVGVLRDEYGVNFDGDLEQWTNYRILAVYLGVSAVGDYLAETLGGSGASAFKEVYKKGVTFIWGRKNLGSHCNDIGNGGCTTSSSQINFTALWGETAFREYEGALVMARNNVVHELGHAFGQMWYKDGVYDQTGAWQCGKGERCTTCLVII